MLIHSEQRQTILALDPRLRNLLRRLSVTIQNLSEKAEEEDSLVQCCCRALDRRYFSWKLRVAPRLLKCKFEKHYRGGKHQHASHIKSRTAGGLCDIIGIQLCNKTRLVHRTATCNCCCWTVGEVSRSVTEIVINAFADKVREGRRNEKQQTEGEQNTEITK